MSWSTLYFHGRYDRYDSNLVTISPFLQAEARLAARRQARYEARNIRLKEIEKKQKEEEENQANHTNHNHVQHPSHPLHPGKL